MALLEGLVVVGLPLAALVLAVLGLRRAGRTVAGRRARAAPWTVECRSLPEGMIAVDVVRPGETAQQVAVLRAADPDFPNELFAARARALEVAAALNATRPTLP